MNVEIMVNYLSMLFILSALYLILHYGILFVSNYIYFVVKKDDISLTVTD